MTFRHSLAATAAALIALAACRAEPQSPVATSTPAPGAAASGEPTGAQSIDERLPVTVRTADGETHVFTAEVARTEEQQAIGMMYRESMAPDAGMLFIFDRPRYASFWMRNTLIPLDIIFLRRDGSIINIEAEATPRSSDPRPSLDIAAAVLEIPGGRAAELGIEPDDRVSWPGGPESQ